MIFYKIVVKFKEVNDEVCAKETAARFQAASELVYEKSNKNCYIFTVRTHLSQMICGAIVRYSKCFKKAMNAYLTECKIETDSVTVDETSLGETRTALHLAERYDYVEDDDAIFSLFDLSYLVSRRREDRFEESILRKQASLRRLEKEAGEIMCESNLPAELQRIFSCHTTTGVKGHPVHYVISTDDRNIRDRSVEILLSALRQKHRIENSRYVTVNYEADAEVLPGELLDSLYHTNIGGALVITFNQGHNSEKESELCSDRSTEMICGICELMKWYKNDVLTVFCLPRNSSRYLNTFIENIDACSVVHLTENPVGGEKAIEYLKCLALKRKVKNLDSVKEIIADDDAMFLTAELNKRFDDWFTRKMKTDYYPEYANSVTGVTKLMMENPKGNAFEELEKMVGLTEAKTVIMRAINYYRAQKLFSDKGMVTDSVSLHMVFTGNPGTAKTTVARLFTQIMKDNGILANGRLFEVGRADIVGKYVGQTAPLVKAAFKKASGGVLFIDEAYSLVDDRDGLYGDEAINTIVQEMENHRDDVVVIFAGYPDKMTQFLNKNPGLCSRIAFHVPFADYNADELCRIAELMAESKGFSFTDDAMTKLHSGFESAKKNPDFGNGRYVRNVLEQAKMALSERVLKINYNDVTKLELSQIRAEDISFIDNIGSKPARRIGFCVD